MSKEESSSLSFHLADLGMKMCCLYSGLALMREHLGWSLAPFLTILLCYPLIFVLNLTLSTWGQMRKSGAVLIGFGLIFVLGLVTFSFPDIRSIEDLKSSQGDLLGVAFQIGLCALLWRLGVGVTPHKTGSRHAHAWFQIGTLARVQGDYYGGIVLHPCLHDPRPGPLGWFRFSDHGGATGHEAAIIGVGDLIDPYSRNDFAACPFA